MTSLQNRRGPLSRGLGADGPLSIPRFVWLLLTCAVILGSSYLVDRCLGQPVGQLSTMINLDGEANLPTWFSAVQWFTVAAVMTLVVDRRFEPSDPRSLALWALPLGFLVFSVDEVVKGHEYAGFLTDVVLPGASRNESPLPSTGAFGFTIGIPFMLLTGLLLVLVRPYLQDASGAFMRIAFGIGLFLLGAVGFDFLSNFLTPDSLEWIAGIYVEETLEMFGATIILWGSYLLAARPD